MKQIENRAFAGTGGMFIRNVGWLQRTMQRYIPEVRTLHNRRSENIKSCKFRNAHTPLKCVIQTENQMKGFQHRLSISDASILLLLPDF
jgi:hypothetical protein